MEAKAVVEYEDGEGGGQGGEGEAGGGDGAHQMRLSEVVAGPRDVRVNFTEMHLVHTVSAANLASTTLSAALTIFIFHYCFRLHRTLGTKRL